MKEKYRIHTVFKEGCPLIETLYREDVALGKLQKYQTSPYVATVKMETLVFDEQSGEWRVCEK